MKTRHEINMIILELVREYLDHYPEMRFGQALINLDIIEVERVNKGYGIDSAGNPVITYYKTIVKDPFYDESETTLERMLTPPGESDDQS